MLGKLIKQELKVTSRYFVPMYVSFAVVTLLLKLSFLFSGGDDIFVQAGTSVFANFFQGLMVFVYVIMLIGISILTYFFIIKRFYSNLFGDEGYLMFTLPVTASQLIHAKLIGAIIWLLIMAPMMIGSFLLLFLGTDAYHSFAEMFGYIAEELHVLEISGYNIGLLVFEIIISGILGTICSLLMFYFAIALAQHFFSEHRLLGTVGCYFGLSIVQSVLQSFIGVFLENVYTDLLMANTTADMLATFQRTVPPGILIYVVLIAAYYVGTHYLLNKKLNLY